MKILLKYSFLLIMLLVLVQCRKDDITNTNGSQQLGNSQNVNFLIQITDENNVELREAIFKIDGDNKNYLPDENGVIILSDIELPKSGLRAHISLDGFHDQYKLLSGRSNSINSLQIILLREKASVNIQTGAQGRIDGFGLLKLPDTLEDESGNVYQGAVKVVSQYYDPDLPGFLNTAPGNMLALNAEDEFIVLASLGMYLVELYSDSGESLNIREGDMAILSFPIAGSQASNIPEEIPLWSFDEETALWKQEGMAKRENGMMVAEVSHFSFWNCDLPYEFVEVCMKFVNRDNEIMTGLRFTFYVDNNRQFGDAITDADGIICGKLPIDKVITIKIFIEEQYVTVATIGPFQSFEDEIIISLNELFAKVYGTALDCQNDVVKEGYGFVKFESGSNVLFQFENDGSFGFWTNSENQNLNLVDLQNEKGLELAVNSLNLEENKDLGNLVLCDGFELSKISGFVNIDEDGDGAADKPLRDIIVKLIKGENDTLTTTSLTNDQGYYEIPVLPGIYRIVIEPYETLEVIASGDLSIDGIGEGDTGVYGPDKLIRCGVEFGEHDQDNNFIMQKIITGNASGRVMIDINQDGVADKSAQGMRVMIYDEQDQFLRNAYTNIEGDYSFSNVPNIVDFIWLVANRENIGFLQDFDSSPDPDGDDSSLGANEMIPIVIQEDENDDDNDFVVSLINSSIICKASLDTNNDGIGDSVASNQRVELYKRTDTGVPVMPLIQSSDSNEGGFVGFWNLEPGEYVLYFIGDGTYTAFDSEDQIPDNNPINTTNQNFFLPVDIVGLEYDDGNVFLLN